MKFELTKIGYISKAFGFKGELRCVLDVAQLSEKHPEFIFVYLDGKPVPFYVEKFHIGKGNFIIKFEDVDDEEKSLAFKNTSIYCETKNFETYFEKEESLDDLIGFEVFDKNIGFIGNVSSIIENKIQPTLEIIFKEKEILIPYSEDIVLNIDEDNNKIEIEAPEGLIEMYLE